MKKSHLDNLIINNPVLVQSFGLVPVLAATKTLKESLTMVLAVTIVMLLSNLFASAFKKFIPEHFESVSMLAMIASFSTITTILIERLLPLQAQSLGIFLPLTVVNSLILYRVRSYALVESVGNSILDALTNALGFAIVMLEVSFIRELLGRGSIASLQIIPTEYTIPTFGEPMFAFILVGFYFAFSNWYVRQKKLKGAK